MTLVLWLIKLATSNKNEFVFKTFKESFRNNLGAFSLVNSDWGYQFTSPSFKIILDSRNNIQSMSRLGHCIDNGTIEGFWGIIKSEIYNLNTFGSYLDLREAIDEYIECTITKIEVFWDSVDLKQSSQIPAERNDNSSKR